MNSSRRNICYFYPEDELEFDTVEICSHCGEENLCDFVENPRIERHHPEKYNPKNWWCQKCYFRVAAE